MPDARPRGRRGNAFVPLLAVALAVLPAGAAGDDVRVTDSSERYTVEGSSRRQLRRAMNRNGPRRGGRRYDAYTEWDVQWWVGLDGTGKGCVVGSVDVHVDVETTLPEWRHGPDVPVRLVERWERYLEALARHERRHRRFGIDAAQEIRRRARDMAARPNCEDMARAVDAMAGEVVERYRRREKAYDRDTRHGVAEGARLR